MMSNGHKIIIAGGGTGGHIFPAIAIARALQRKEPDIDILFVGAKGKMEMEKVPEAGFKIIGLNIAGMNRSSWLKNITLPFKILSSLWQAKRIIKAFQPDVAIGVGGYASFPVLNVAQSKGIPTLIQEQNSFAGKTNVLLGKKAFKVCVAVKGMELFFPKNRIVITGNPVRRDIVTADMNREKAIAHFGLRPDRKTVFIVGGSLGARSVNLALLAHIDELTENNIQLIWQTGNVSFEVVQDAVKGKEDTIKIFKFISEIEKAYAAADVIISRAGALALSELSVVGRPVIFVPYPAAAEDHQTKNAQSFVKNKAALMIKDNEAKDKLVDTLLALLKDETLQKQLAKNIKQLAITNADERIANEILKLV